MIHDDNDGNSSGRPRQDDFQESGEDRQGLGATPEVGRQLDFICHDLRHPLTAILAYSEFLAEHDLDTSQRRDFHQEIRLAVNQMNDLISLLLESSRDSEDVPD